MEKWTDLNPVKKCFVCGGEYPATLDTSDDPCICAKGPASKEEIEARIEKLHRAHHHEPVWTTLAQVPGEPRIIDIWCQCGVSGTVQISAENIEWDPMFPEQYA